MKIHTCNLILERKLEDMISDSHSQRESILEYDIENIPLNEREYLLLLVDGIMGNYIYHLKELKILRERLMAKPNLTVVNGGECSD